MRPLAIAMAVAMLATPALAEEACGDVVEVEGTRLLRQLTLDLYGRVPTVDELEALGDGPVGEAEVDALLAGEEFKTLVRRHHADLLWPSTEALDIIGGAVALLLPASFYDGIGDGQRLFHIFVGFYERGGLVPCKDEPAEWDANGDLVFEQMPDGTRREGWVMVEPYWAPGTEVKVCALEARTDATGASGAACNTAGGLASGTCGCGPNLQHCAGFQAVIDMVGALQEQQLRMAEAPILAGRPYTDMLLAQTEEVNGPIAHYYRYLAPMGVDPFIQYSPLADGAMPDVPYDDMTWHTVERKAPQSAGILTSMSYLLRFQTSRARANQFYNAFLCQPFVAPAGGLPSPNDACSQEPDLRKRCGCNACHAQLEPSAGHWGRFADAGAAWLDPQLFPTYVARCAECARRGGQGCDFVCERFYVSEVGHPDELPYAGVLKSYQWRGEAEVAKVEGGPRLLVEQAMADGRLAQCAAQKLFTRFYHREPTAEERNRDLPRFAQAFTASDYDFKVLVKALLTDPGYRRMQR
ncbi:MAG: hypothetical protein H6706_00725 [Myxococcales bacterium]|nr:hypothetical protein [Myxococcales bacterium]